MKRGEAKWAREKKSVREAAAKEAERDEAMSACEKAAVDLERRGGVALQNWEKGDAKKALSVAGNALKAASSVVALASDDPEVCQKLDEVCRLHAALETQRAAWQKADQKAKADAKTNRAAARKAAAPQQPQSVRTTIAVPLGEADGDLPCAEVYTARGNTPTFQGCDHRAQSFVAAPGST